jgi:hypothetical protein
VAAEVEAKYGKPATWFKPAGVSTREEFERKYGEQSRSRWTGAWPDDWQPLQGTAKS